MKDPAPLPVKLDAATRVRVEALRGCMTAEAYIAAFLASALPEPTDPVCWWCGISFPRPSPVGPMPRYCKPAHRQAMWRANPQHRNGGRVPAEDYGATG